MQAKSELGTIAATHLDVADDTVQHPLPLFLPIKVQQLQLLLLQEECVKDAMHLPTLFKLMAEGRGRLGLCCSNERMFLVLLNMG
jgi:hypothetical protein